MLVCSLGRLALSVTQPHAGRKRASEFCKREARGRASSKTAKQGTRSPRRPCHNTTGTADRFRSSVGVARCSPARPARHDPWDRPEKRIGTRDIVICRPGSDRPSGFGRGRGPARTDDSLGGVRRQGRLLRLLWPRRDDIIAAPDQQLVIKLVSVQRRRPERSRKARSRFCGLPTMDGLRKRRRIGSFTGTQSVRPVRRDSREGRRQHRPRGAAYHR